MILTRIAKEAITSFIDFRPFDDLGLSGVGAEIGVAKGIHARYMLRKNPGITRLYLIDPYLPYDEHQDHRTNKLIARLLLWPYRKKCRFIYNPSRLIPRVAFDFVYIDAGHSFQAVSEDMVKVWPLIVPGGIMGGHDFWDCPGVEKAVKDFCDGYSLDYTVRKTDWWIRK